MFNDRYERLLGMVGDEFVREQLLIYKDPESDEHADARDRLYFHLVERFRTLKRAQKQSQSAHSQLSEVMHIMRTWISLANDILYASECLWLGLLLPYTSEQQSRQELRQDSRWLRFGSQSDDEPPDLGALRVATRMSQQLMSLWLEASLYRMRAFSNSTTTATLLPVDGKDNPTRATIQKLFVGKDGYLKTIRTWDIDLNRVSGHLFYKYGPSAIPQFKSILQEFGPQSVGEYDEGWAAQAADAEDELRYQLREEIRREKGHAWRFLPWLGYTALKWTTGYGTRPANFLRTTAYVIPGFALLFFLNDFLNPGPLAVVHGAVFCPESRVSVAHWYDWFVVVAQLVVKYLYLAVTNLSSLGSDGKLASYCGGVATQALLICAALTGYFLLALLASLFFKLLSETN